MSYKYNILSRPIRGYKICRATNNPNVLRCIKELYKVEETKTLPSNLTIIPCHQGYHFCINPMECLLYYTWSNDTRLVEVIASGTIYQSDNQSKCVTNQITITRICSLEESLKLLSGILRLQKITIYYKNGLLHNPDGPAYSDEFSEMWYICGLRHRINGTAWINKSTGKKRYFILGDEIENLE